MLRIDSVFLLRRNCIFLLPNPGKNSHFRFLLLTKGCILYTFLSHPHPGQSTEQDRFKPQSEVGGELRKYIPILSQKKYSVLHFNFLCHLHIAPLPM